MHSIIDSIRNDIAKGEIGDALHKFTNLLKHRNKKLYNSCIMLSSDYNEYKNNQMLGIKTSSEDYQRIKYSVLELLSKLEEGQIYLFEKEDELLLQLETVISNSVALMHQIPLISSEIDTSMLVLGSSEYMKDVASLYSDFSKISKQISNIVFENNKSKVLKLLKEISSYVLMSRQGAVNEITWRFVFEYELSILLKQLENLLKTL